GRLAVHVATAHHGIGVGVGAVAADEQVADRIGESREAAGLGPGGELVAGRRVLGRQRLAVDPAFRRAAELCHVGMALPQTLLVDGTRWRNSGPAHASSLYASFSSPPIGGEARRGGCTSSRSPLTQPLPLSGDRRIESSRDYSGVHRF